MLCCILESMNGRVTNLTFERREIMHDFIRYSEIDENKILPCPFCGGHAVLIKTYCKDTKYIGYHIFHGNCSLAGALRTSSFNTPEEAIKMWNKRMG